MTSVLVLQVPGSLRYGIFATLWHPTGGHFPMSWAANDTSVPGLDVTESYLKKSPPDPAAVQ